MTNAVAAYGMPVTPLHAEIASDVPIDEDPVLNVERGFRCDVRPMQAALPQDKWARQLIVRR
ncbi:hypothetical protein DWU98_19975 [Dyella monticola]|uniref:Uncharacterized protein n=1 Tax=Dyella monticola TaxID=1927958 RepID=A0A370WSG3_9GAMM|nr:hypothetical protein DWU98_19975 [Dyella monticola]